jgi:hypothetical protein
MADMNKKYNQFETEVSQLKYFTEANVKDAVRKS